MHANLPNHSGYTYSSAHVNMQLYSTWIGRNEGVLLTEKIIRAEAPKHVRNVVARLFKLQLGRFWVIDRFSIVV